MYYQTRTLTHTLTYTYTDVRHVNWKIRSDLRYLRFMYSLFSEKYEEEMSADLYKWVLAGYTASVKFLFYISLGMELKFGLQYHVSAKGVVTRDDDAGNIPYIPLPSGTRFEVIVVPNHNWWQLTQEQKERFYATLSPGWGDSKLRLIENPSLWTSDSVYSSNALSVRRDIYKTT